MAASPSPCDPGLNHPGHRRCRALDHLCGGGPWQSVAHEVLVTVVTAFALVLAPHSQATAEEEAIARPTLRHGSSAASTP